MTRTILLFFLLTGLAVAEPVLHCVYGFPTAGEAWGELILEPDGSLYLRDGGEVVRTTVEVEPLMDDLIKLGIWELESGRPGPEAVPLDITVRWQGREHRAHYGSTERWSRVKARLEKLHQTLIRD